MRFRAPAALTVVALCALATPSAQETIDRDVSWKIRREATDNSHIMRTLQVLTDLYGPRLTGSPNLHGAAEWVVKEATAWGLKNAKLEPWEFGHPGWLNEKLSVHVVSPVKDALVVEAVAWTPGTNGPITAQILPIELPRRPTTSQLAEFFEAQRAAIKGRIVMVGTPEAVTVTIDPPAKRREDSAVRAQFDGPGTPGGPQGPQPIQKPEPDVLPPAQVNERFDQFLAAGGALGRVNDAGRDHGQIRAFNNRTFDITKAVSTIVMRNEDYGRLWRLAASGRAVELEMNIVNRSYPEGRTQYNVVAEIPGTDKAAEVVMLGGHLDSWHSATGATDNAIGCATMLEAIRILQAIGVQPRRTIRVALWSGEEQGLLGSQAYVKQHFGSFESPTPEHAAFAGYFNIDSGTGRARGMTVFGPEDAARIVRDATRPFEDNGFLGVTATTSRRRGGSDHTSFNEVGLPGIGVQQDPIEYQTHTWHTNLDTYERVIEDDARQSAMVIAAAVYHLAMRNDLLPRLPKTQMPPLPTP
jgi:carboxypeptidase Q